MSYPDRATQMAIALEALGLGSDAGFQDVRMAWKHIAFTTHPDRNHGDRSAFDKAKAAYDFLVKQVPPTRPGKGEPQRAAPTPSAPKAPAPGRPRVTTRAADLSLDTRYRCRAALDADAAPMESFRIGDTADAHIPPDGTESRTDHVPTSILRHGRDVTFLIDNPLAPGANRVAVPRSLFGTRRAQPPIVVALHSSIAGPREVEMPEAVRARVFPDTRTVTFCFSGA